MFGWFKRILDGIGCRQQVLADARREELEQEIAFYKDVLNVCNFHGEYEEAALWEYMINRASKELDECD